MANPLPYRIFSALPDIAMAGYFAVLWVQPEQLGPGALRFGLLLMLVEFILIHATALLGHLVHRSGAADLSRFAAVLGLSALYSVFIVAFVVIFDARWPLVAFGILILGKLVSLFNGRRPSQQASARMQGEWGFSCLAYVGGVFVTLFLPLPRLGLTDPVVAAADLPGSGHWVSHPHSVVAFGLLYFGLLAASKIKGWTLPRADGSEASP